jgi:DNA gyrase subunit A
MNTDVYRSQNRGGKGMTGIKTNEDDVVEHLIYASTHDYLLFFTNLGRVYKMKGYKVPNFGRTSKGLPIVNLLNLDENETLAAVAKIEDFESENFLFFATKRGVVKRTPVSDFTNIRTTGIKAINLREDDELLAVKLTDGTKDVIIGASNGKAIRFHEETARSMGRVASGVRGILIGEDDDVIGFTVVSEEKNQILVVTENGYGKKTNMEEYRQQNRGGKGVKTLNITDKNGNLAKLLSVVGDEDLIITTTKGMIIRVPVEQIATSKRSTQGVRLIRLNDGHSVATIAIVPKAEEIEEIEAADVENTEVTDQVSVETAENQVENTEETVKTEE